MTGNPSANQNGGAPEKKTRAKRAVSVRRIIIPAILTILVLLIVLVVNTLYVNRLAQSISDAAQRNLDHTNYFMQLNRSVDRLAELSRSFVGKADTAVLKEYYAEVDVLQTTGYDLLEKLQASGLGRAGDYLRSAIDSCNARWQVEQYAMRLSAEAARFDLADYPSLRAVMLRSEDASLTPSAMRDAAAAMLLRGDYEDMRGDVQRSLNVMLNMAGAGTETFIRQQNVAMGRARVFQWIVMAAVLVIIAGMALFLFRRLIHPLERGVKLVQQGTPVPEDVGFLELRRLAGTYNGLLAYRARVENDLRDQSRTDALTGLPNRLALQDYVSELASSTGHETVTVFSMDVDDLKLTNDSQGHAAGDRLLCSAAAAIQATFDDGTGRNCFRFGGDEFAAFWTDASEDRIQAALQRFRSEQIKRGVHISIGHASASELEETTIKTLFERADRYMYVEKAQSKPHDREGSRP